MRRRWRALACLCLCGVLAWFLADAGPIRQSAAEALSLCVRSVVPSLFPFLVISGLLVSMGIGELAAPYLAGFMGPLYRLPGCASSALLLGRVGGYPIGAKTAADLYREGLLSRDEAEQLYRHLWIYTHGIAVLCATNMCVFTAEETGRLVTQAFRGILKEIKTEIKTDRA